jgi:hypothetical protein
VVPKGVYSVYFNVRILESRDSHTNYCTDASYVTGVDHVLELCLIAMLRRHLVRNGLVVGPPAVARYVFGRWSNLNVPIAVWANESRTFSGDRIISPLKHLENDPFIFE